MPERRLYPDLAQWIVQTLARLTATYAILQGFFIVLGGPERWQGKSLATAMSVPGAPASWGIVLGVLGALALAGSFRPRLQMVAWSLLGVGVWSLFFAVSLLVTFLNTPRTPTTGLFTYAYLGVAALFLASAYNRSRP